MSKKKQGKPATKECGACFCPPELRVAIQCMRKRWHSGPHRCEMHFEWEQKPKRGRHE